MYILNLDNSKTHPVSVSLTGNSVNPDDVQHLENLINSKVGCEIVSSLPEASENTTSKLYLLKSSPDSSTFSSISFTETTEDSSGSIVSYNWIHFNVNTVTSEEKNKWNNKVNCSVNEDDEMLIFTRE